MKIIRYVLSWAAVALAQVGVAAQPVVYPKEIEHCEPCKRLWLAKRDQPAPVDAAPVDVEPLVPRAAVSDAVVYPKEIKDCEPCKRIWLSKRPRPVREGVADNPAPK